MLVDENKKNEEKNEKLLADFCECYLLLNEGISSKTLSISVPCLLKVGLKKEESEEAQKEVEMALLALSNINLSWNYQRVTKELYFSEITEIIEYHQEHRNLTRLAYQSAWKFLINRLDNDKGLEEIIINELHFVEEAARELKELTRNADWMKTEEKDGGKDAKEVHFLIKWFNVIYKYLYSCNSWNKGNVGLICCVVNLFRTVKDDYREISVLCSDFFGDAMRSKSVKVDDLLKGEAIDLFLEKIIQSTLNDKMTYVHLLRFMNVSRQLKGKENDEKEESKRKTTKRKELEKMEEEGHEDIITSFHEIIDFLNRKYHRQLSTNISDYFVYV
eukprot:MONOS_8043.1-p1 / transcript=MONOS_8043.1 / gene=MONOS_8043 / organism=Monocercomonoides_exilis_PA203 / gene_product=unspecified product / transcript_product=unspecified product / location=Mono_scaffold00292:52456-53501(-) / protein_length=332 / sequence_SO=supercontig / SO=protein_coding / is_pseudo=false